MKKINLTFSVSVAVLSCVHVLADSWALPTPKKYYSENKQYYFEVIPRVLDSQLKYFEDKVAKREPAGSKPDVVDNYCKGIFYTQDKNGKYEKLWETRLSNDVAPVGALVSDGGEYVVTFDNWHSVGYGDDVVAIYGSGGTQVRKMSLSDIFPQNSAVKLPRSVSSIYWGGKHHIDEKNQQLVLRVVSKWSGSFQDEPEFKEMRVDLRTGQFIRQNQAAD
jgi:hypothetical protein